MPESAVFTADRTTADVDQTLAHVAYMHICSGGSAVTFGPARTLGIKKSALQAEHRPLSRLSHAPLRFPVALTKVVNKRNTGVVLLVVRRLLWIALGLLSGLILGSPLTEGLSNGKDSARIDVEVRHEHLQ